MIRVSSALSELRGWRRHGAAALLGAIACAALPPFHVVPALWIAFTGLLWLGGGVSARTAFATGWWFGLGHFVVGLYWLSNALLIDPLRFAWLIPFAVLGLPAALAVFPAASLWIASWFGASPLVRVVAFAIAWTAFEWVRGHGLTGFPWNLVGYSWMETLTVAQIGAWVGAYGLSFVTVLAAATPATITASASRAFRWAPGLLSLVAIGAIGAWGAARLAAHPTEFVPDLRLRVVQASVPQTLKWREDYRDSAFAQHLELSRSPANTLVTHLIWPETAVPFLLADEPERRRVIAGLLPQGGALLTGSVRASETASKQLKLWNSVLAINSAGTVVATYDKVHLVPFGEYLPFRSILAQVGIDKLVYGPVDFSSGPGLTTMRIPGLPSLGPLVCYEAIFPGRVAERSVRPDWLLNVSNDGWYGDSAGPYQHLAMARMRSIEEGLPLVRAANTGISAVVDPLGRTFASLGYGVVGVIDAGIPNKLPPTLYSRCGDFILIPLLIVLAAFFLAKGVTSGTSVGRGRS